MVVNTITLGDHVVECRDSELRRQSLILMSILQYSRPPAQRQDNEFKFMPATF